MSVLLIKILSLNNCKHLNEPGICDDCETCYCFDCCVYYYIDSFNKIINKHICKDQTEKND